MTLSKALKLKILIKKSLTLSAINDTASIIDAFVRSFSEINVICRTTGQ